MELKVYKCRNCNKKVNLMNKKIMGVYKIKNISKKKINIKEMGLADFLVADINKLQNALKK